MFLLVHHLLASALPTWWRNPGCGGRACTMYELYQHPCCDPGDECSVFGLSFSHPHLCPSESLHSLLSICRKAKSFLLEKRGLVHWASVPGMAMHYAKSNENTTHCIRRHLEKTHTGSVTWLSHHFPYRQPIGFCSQGRRINPDTIPRDPPPLWC